MKTIKKIKNSMKMKTAADAKTRGVLSESGKKAVSGCPELSFGNSK